MMNKRSIRAMLPIALILLALGTISISADAEEMMVDGFERPMLSNDLDWETCGNSASVDPLDQCRNPDPDVPGWEIERSEGCYEGQRCARSGLDGHDDKASTLELTVEVPEDLEEDQRVVSFRHRVSSEGGYDGLVFFIDGESQDAWSGARDWEQAGPYRLEPGEHRLQWIYAKDSTVDSGEDAAWIDNVRLPRNGGPPPPQEIPLQPPERSEVGEVAPDRFARGTVEVEDEDGTTEEEVSRQYTVEIPNEGAELLAVQLQANGDGNLDLYARQGQHVIAPPDLMRVKSDFASISPGGEEVIVIQRPTPGSKYWFAVENRDPDSAQFQITAWLFPEIQDVESGAEAEDRVGVPNGLPPALTRALGTRDRDGRDGLLGLTQYHVAIPEDAESLQVQVEGEGEGNLGLHLRFGQPIGVDDANLQINADISSLTPGNTQQIVLSNGLLEPGDLYISIEGWSPPQPFTLRVEIETPNGTETLQAAGPHPSSVDTVRIVPIQPSGRR